MDARSRIQFRKLFPDSWNQLQRQGAVLHSLSPDEKTSPSQTKNSTKGWRRNRLVAVLSRLFSRSSHSGQQASKELSQQLFHGYLNELENHSEPRSQALQQRAVHTQNPQQQPVSRAKINSQPQLKLALAMQLAGLATIHQNQNQNQHHHQGQDQLTLKFRETGLNAGRVQKLDHCLNCSSVRLAYEYLAANRSQQLPPQFLSLILIPELSEQLQASTGLSAEESTNLVKELLQRHKVKTPGDLSLENLMEIKNTIRRLGSEHRRVVEAIAPHSKLPPSPSPEASGKPLNQRQATITSHQSKTLLAESGASLNSTQKYFENILVQNGLSPAKARKAATNILTARGISHDTDITLGRLVLVADDIARHCAKAGNRTNDSREHTSEVLVLKYINQLRPNAPVPLPRRQITPSATSGITAVKTPNIPAGGSVPKPRLAPPEVNPDIVCDADDEWMIQHQVDNGHLVRLTRDMAMRAVRWCGRNKRVIGREAGLLVVLGVFYGVQTGGLSVAVMLLTYVLSGVTWLAIDAVSDRVHRIFIRKKLNRADALRGSRTDGTEPGKEVDDYLDSYSWLTRHGGLTDILNGFRNLQQNVAALNRKPNDPHMTAKERIQRRKAQALCQMRSQQLGGAFQSLDHLVVESVQEVSRLDHHFMENFQTLWDPFEKMDERSRVKIFNEAANSRELRNNWFLPRRDYSGWMKETLGYRHSGVDKVALVAEQHLNFEKPLTEQELKMEELSTHLDRSAKLGKKALKATVHTAKDYVVYTLRSTVWRYIESALGKAVMNVNPTAAGLAPIPTAAGAIFWIYCFAATKVTNGLNKLHNRATVKRYIATHRQDRFDDGFYNDELSDDQSPDQRKQAGKNRKDFDNSFLSLRREAKDTTKTMIKTLKKLRQEKQLIDEELQRQLKTDHTLEHGDYVHRARLILRHKMLEKQFYETLNGAFGNMHNETIKAASWLQKEAGLS